MLRITAALVAGLALSPVGAFVPSATSAARARAMSTAASARRAPASGSAAQPMTMMPLGIPKVAYKIPGAQTADWIDIYNRLYRERIIFLGQEIDDEIANQVRARARRSAARAFRRVVVWWAMPRPTRHTDRWAN